MPQPYAQPPTRRTMPVSLNMLRLVLFLLPIWALARIVELAAADTLPSNLFEAASLAVWLLAPGVFALVCGLLLRGGGPALLYTIAAFAAAMVPLQILLFLLRVPFLYGLPTALAVGIPLCFPSAWRYVRSDRHEWPWSP